jgi:hypothetical protein
MINFLHQACTNLRPEAGISIDENGIHWHGIDSIPAQEEVDAEVARLEAEYALNAYKANRQAEYPPITDYLDGVVKGDQTQIDKYIADCLAVKAKYPKE